MILHDLTGTENDPTYKELAISNGARQYDFLVSIIKAALEKERPFLSQTIIKALNFHAIACLHPYAGQYRPCPVTVGGYRPPEHYSVPTLMDDFTNMVNHRSGHADPLEMGAYVLWRLNYIHPFINGNGRSARAACYFVLCVQLGGLLGGMKILPELLKEQRDRYVVALQAADESFSLSHGQVDLSELKALISELLAIQLASSNKP